MIIYILHYHYPDGTFAGIIGAYSDESKAIQERDSLKATHSDCIIILTTCGVQ